MFKAIINLLALQAPSATLSDTHLSGQLFLGVSKYHYLMAQWSCLAARMNFLPHYLRYSIICDLEFFKKYLFIYLVVPVLVAARKIFDLHCDMWDLFFFKLWYTGCFSCGTQKLVAACGIQFLTRDWTQVPCTGHVESQPLGHWRRPYMV